MTVWTEVAAPITNSGRPEVLYGTEQFSECGTCYAVVRVSQQDAHTAWHGVALKACHKAKGGDA